MKQADRKNKNVGLTLPAWAIEALAAEASARGTTKSGFVQSLLAPFAKKPTVRAKRGKAP